MSNPEKLTQSLRNESARLGFDLFGVCSAVDSRQFQQFESWLEAGYAGEMKYMADRKKAYRSPRGVLDGAKSIVMLGTNYQTITPRPVAAGQARISRYAWNDSDYHDIIHERLKQLKLYLQRHAADSNSRGVIDTAPLLEREFAQMAGLGWQAKNTMLINRDIGSWFFLSAILTDLELVYDDPFATDHCGTCTACLDACPTDAFVSPQVLDATKCISYLTIEHRTAIPIERRAEMGQWLFGCDICQDVCPWNRKPATTDKPEFQPRAENNPVDLCGLFLLDDEQFRARFRKTPLWRPKRRGILRNAAIALGNSPVEAGMAALRRGLNDVEPLVRGASAWALGNYESQSAIESLTERASVETDTEVILEIAGSQDRWRKKFG